MRSKIKIFMMVVALAGGLFVMYGSWSTPNTDRDESEKPSVVQKNVSKIDDQASVTVTVTPVLLSVESDVLEFDVVMDTHSVELDQNMVDVAVLVDDRGTRYPALNWQGSSGGHHREGVLTFNQVVPTPKSVELVISGIGGITRNFTWDVTEDTWK